MQGTIIALDRDRGFLVIRPDTASPSGLGDLIATATEVRGFDGMRVGQRVTYERSKDDASQDEDRPVAIEVRALGGSEFPAR